MPNKKKTFGINPFYFFIICIVSVVGFYLTLVFLIDLTEKSIDNKYTCIETAQKRSCDSALFEINITTGWNEMYFEDGYFTCCNSYIEYDEINHKAITMTNCYDFLGSGITYYREEVSCSVCDWDCEKIKRED